MDDLPIHGIKAHFLSKLAERDSVIIRAPTGSGKSTKIPQYIRSMPEIERKILVLEPRRLAAKMVASRVAYEMDTFLGGSVGFQTRYERVFSSDTSILFITEGILPRKMVSDPLLRDVSVVVFDEFHERSLATDLGLALVKRLQQNERRDLKIVVSSATIDVEPLLDYLPNAAVIEASGRCYDVEIGYCPVEQGTAPWQSGLIGVRKMMKETSNGDILVFQPGAYDIRKCVEAIRSENFGERVVVAPLYGELSPEQQRAVMEKSPIRKIIVATNIAETSLTIPGVRHVVDTGLAKINRFDSGRGFNRLQLENISHASADQRAGRAGREASGRCIRMWSLASHASRPRMGESEIRRADIVEAVLSLKALGIASLASFNWFEAPTANSVEAAERLLKELRAVDSNGLLTERGVVLSKIPAHPRLATLLVESSIRGVEEKGAFAVALLNERPFISGRPDLFDMDDIKKSHSDFDFLETIAERVVRASFSQGVCVRLGVNGGVLRQVLRNMSDYMDTIKSLKLDKKDSQDSDSVKLTKAIISAYPDRLARFRNNRTLQYEFSSGKSGELERESAARGSTLIVASSVREIRKEGKMADKTILSMACGIEEEWLLELFPDNWTSESGIKWNEERGDIQERSVLKCLGVVIEEVYRSATHSLETEELLAMEICGRNLKLSGWTEEVDKLIKRVFFAAKYTEMPAWSPNDRREIVTLLCRGEASYSSVKNKDILPLLKRELGDKYQQLEKIAPDFILLPNGRKMAISYELGRPPFGKARIQDLYDLKTLPEIAGGREKMAVEILAPNQRPVQVTDDLQGFWKNHYPELKTRLSRKYPKHEWR